MKGFPKGVWFQKKRLSGGEVIRYGYYGRGIGMVALGREGTAEFHERLAEALRREPGRGTVANLIWQYKQSAEFLKLAPRTKTDYLAQLDKIQVRFGALKYVSITNRAIIPHLFKWRDSMAASPKQANYALTVLKLLLAWSVKRGILHINQAAGIDKLREGDRREKSWSDSDIARFMAVAPEPLRRAMTLAVETGQRQNDLLTLTWNAVSEGVVSLRQKKTKIMVAVAVSEALRACLESAPRADAVTILTKADGQPWEPKGNGFRQAWRDATKAAGLAGLTFHDLRGTFVTRRLSEGWSREDVAYCTGHSLRNLAMLDVYADREKVARANANRITRGAERKAK